MYIFLIRHNKGLKESKIIKNKIKYRVKEFFKAHIIFCDPLLKARFFQEQKNKILKKIKQIEKDLKLNILEFNVTIESDVSVQKFPIDLTKDPFYDEMKLQVIGENYEK